MEAFRRARRKMGMDDTTGMGDMGVMGASVGVGVDAEGETEEGTIPEQRMSGKGEEGDAPAGGEGTDARREKGKRGRGRPRKGGQPLDTHVQGDIEDGGMWNEGAKRGRGRPRKLVTAGPWA